MIEGTGPRHVRSAKPIAAGRSPAAEGEFAPAAATDPPSARFDHSPRVEAQRGHIGQLFGGAARVRRPDAAAPVLQRARIPAARAGAEQDLDTDERFEFARLIRQVDDLGRLDDIRQCIERELQDETLDRTTRLSDTYALGFVREQVERVELDRRRGSLAESPAGADVVADASLHVAKKASVTAPDATPDLLEIVADADVYSAGVEDVDTGSATEPLPMPDHDHYRAEFGKATQVVGHVRRGQFAVSPGNWFDSPYPKCVGPFWAIAPVPARAPFTPWVPDSVDLGAQPFAALLRRAAVPFVVTTAPMADASFGPAAGDLFPREPRRDDVQQGELADCGLLAALAGIVTREPGFIRGMLRDLGNGQVLVRLFDIAVQPDNRWAFTPRLVVIDKSTVMKNAAQGQTDYFAKTGGAGPGGLWVAMIEKAYVAAGYLGTFSGRTDRAHLAMGNLEGGNLDFVYGHVRGERGDYRDIDPAVVPAKGARRSQTYSPPLVAWFEAIGRAVDGPSPKTVILESKDEVGRSAAGARGHSGGEAMAKGLVGGHAYTVLRTEQSQGRRYLVLRNPWGSYGRDYDWNAAKGVTPTAREVQGTGEFRLELNDAAKRFRKSFVGA